MFRFIKISFVAVLALIVSSCIDTSSTPGLEVPQTQDQQAALNNNSNLDKFVDVVEPFNDTEVEKSSVIKDNNSSSESIPTPEL